MSRKLPKRYNGSSTGRGRRPLKLQVRLFALYRDRLGMDTLEVELEEGVPVTHLAERLTASYPNVFPPASDLVIAVNQEYADPALILQQGDEVALIPPVSGG